MQDGHQIQNVQRFMCSWYEMLAIAFNLKSGLSTSEKRLNFESTLQPTKVYHVIFSKQRYLVSQKTLIQSVPFLIPLSIPLLYIVCEGKNIDNGGVPVRGGGRESKVREPRRQMGLIKWNLYLCD